MINTDTNKLVPVEQADDLILSEQKDFGNERVSFFSSNGRVLAENITADRDMPPFDRVAMDGIAIRFAAIEKGSRRFHIVGIQAAGAQPVEISGEDECIEIMTGAALPGSADTVIRYEDVEVSEGYAVVNQLQVIKGQHIHYMGSDRRQNQVVLSAGQVISPAAINILASVGKTAVLVKKLPAVVVISTGDELTDIHETPSPIQIRRSNSYAIQSALASRGIDVTLEHIPDDPSSTTDAINDALQTFDVIVLSGGVSMGRFDFVEKAMTTCGVHKRFYKVQQKPGKPFWFGVHPSGPVVFAFPGNPVSTFMCLYRYLVPWLQKCLGLPVAKQYAVLTETVTFRPAMQYFLQVKLKGDEKGLLHATPMAGNGSGDFANLTDSDAFIELPASKETFNAGEAYRVWQYK